MNFEQVIGLEVHCELKTDSKMFSGAPVTFGALPHTKVNEIDMAMPGTMPSLNKRAVEFAIKVCYMLHMEIDELLCFDRKNYYYSDLPKGFQITQERRPIGKNGYLDIEIDDEQIRVEIERLHMEEDTAKQVHLDDYTLIDYNRAGIPLIEIVTKPTLHNSTQAVGYLEKLRQILIYTGVSDAKMEEGSMRCDVNISIKPVGQIEYGTRTEIKNLNSLSNVKKAIEFEALRQAELLAKGEHILQETRRFDEALQETIIMRTKGDAVDYKYYPEPNILPIRLNHQWVLDIKKHIPMMADEREKIYQQKYGLSKNQAHSLVAVKEISDFYEKTIQICQAYQLVCHWLLGDVQAYLNKEKLRLEQTRLTPIYLGKMIQLIENGMISSKQAKIVLYDILEEGKDPEEIIMEKGMVQISDPALLNHIIQEVLDENKQSINDYAAGKNKAIGFLIGQVMKKSRGQANPKMTNLLLVQLLNERTE